MDDSLKGMAFLRENDGRYELVMYRKNNGDYVVNLIRNNSDNSVSIVIQLDIGGLYAQCNPDRIVERLRRNINEGNNMIEIIKSDAAANTPF